MMRLPDANEATELYEWFITPSHKIHPDQIAPLVITSQDQLKAEYVTWKEDFPRAAVWQRTLLRWPSGDSFMEAWHTSNHLNAYLEAHLEAHLAKAQVETPKATGLIEITLPKEDGQK